MKIALVLVLVLSFVCINYSFTLSRGLLRINVANRGLRSLPRAGVKLASICGSEEAVVLVQESKSNRIYLRGISKVVSRFLAGLIIALGSMAKKVNAADAIKGWDLYGRVPHDDWLFTTWRLTSPNMLRSTMTEAIANELPTMLYAYRRRKRLNELVTTFGGVGVVAATALFVGFLYKSRSFATSRASRQRARSGVSAISKKGQKKGRDIDDMGDGWVDMDDEDLD